MIRYALSLSVFLIFGPQVFAQKVKYKELFELLKSRQLETAETHLKRYLKENDDNPNAFYYMGLTFQEKAGKLDPLVSTEAVVTTSDSALFFLDKAYRGIDERELKKNDEYYESFSKRDVRTGKFEIKLSDVRLDLEDRMKGLRTRKERITTLKENWSKARDYYSRAQTQYIQMLSRYSAERDFYLRADEVMIEDLKKIGSDYDSAIIYFNEYKSVAQLLGKIGHNQLLNVVEIKDIKRDGASPADFLKEDVKVWDYKTWTSSSLEVITNEILPLRTKLVAMDAEINQIREKQKRDSVSQKTQLSQLGTKALSDQLKKFDPDPMPILVFEMNITDVRYTSDLLEHRRLKDSADVKTKLDFVRREINILNRLDSLSISIVSRDFAKEAIRYQDFISKAYGTAAVLRANAKGTNEYALREKLKREREWERFSQSLKWEVSGTDSIPLFQEVGRVYKLKPLVIADENYTAGLKYADSVALGYFYTITPSRIPDVKVSFPLDGSSFKKRNLPLLKGVHTSDGNGQIFFVLFYSEGKTGDRFPAVLAKIYRTDGLAWANPVALDAIPSELYYSAETGEVSIKMTGSTGDSRILTLDKAGKIIQ